MMGIAQPTQARALWQYPCPSSPALWHKCTPPPLPMALARVIPTLGSTPRISGLRGIFRPTALLNTSAHPRPRARAPPSPPNARAPPSPPRPRAPPRTRSLPPSLSTHPLPAQSLASPVVALTPPPPPPPPPLQVQGYPLPRMPASLTVSMMGLLADCAASMTNEIAPETPHERRQIEEALLCALTMDGGGRAGGSARGCSKISFVEPLYLDEPNAPLNRDPTFEALLKCGTSKAVGKVRPMPASRPPHASPAPKRPRPTVRRALAAGRATAPDQAVLHGPVQVDAQPQLQQPPGRPVRVQGVRPLPLRPQPLGAAARPAGLLPEASLPLRRPPLPAGGEPRPLRRCVHLASHACDHAPQLPSPDPPRAPPPPPHPPAAWACRRL